MDVSGWDVTELVFVPPGALEPGPPTSDPLADAAELGTPPALAELSEYMDETDMRLGAISDSDGAARSWGSGNEELLESSAILVGASLGVSVSSTADSSLFGIPAFPPICLADSMLDGARVLYVEEVRDLDTDGGGIEMEAESALVSVMLGSACRPFFEVVDEEFEAERLCEAGVADFDLGTAAGGSALGTLAGLLCCGIPEDSELRRGEVDSTIPLAHGSLFAWRWRTMIIL